MAAHSDRRSAAGSFRNTAKMIVKITIVDSGLSSDQVHPSTDRLYFPRSSRSVRLRVSSRACRVLLERAHRRPTVARPVAGKGTERAHHMPRAAEPTRGFMSPRTSDLPPLVRPVEPRRAALGASDTPSHPNRTSPCRLAEAPSRPGRL